MTLENLGAAARHLSFELHGDQLDPWLVKAQEMISVDSHASVRASRGSARVKISEISIAVKQTPGSPVPDGRDFHRALVGLYCWIGAVNRPWARQGSPSSTLCTYPLSACHLMCTPSLQFKTKRSKVDSYGGQNQPQ